MKLIVKFITLFCIILIGNSSFAQQQWTLQQCIEHAMKNNLQVRIAILNNEAKQGQRFTQFKFWR
jgi:two-component sensor histidine kinase